MSKLIVNAKAPLFSGEDIYGKTHRFTFTEGWTFISFHRFAACPFCNMRTHELIKNFNRFKMNDIKIISLWPSSRKEMSKISGNEEAPFPMLCDADMEIFKKYSVIDKSMLGFVRLMLHPKIFMASMKHVTRHTKLNDNIKLMPANFLISPAGKLELVHYGKHFADHIELEDIFKTVNQNKRQYENSALAI